MFRKILFILSLAFLINSCEKDSITEKDKSLDQIDPVPMDTVTAPVIRLGLSSERISETPFLKPRESIVYQGNLYVIDDSVTYKYDFTSNEWEVVNTQGEDVAVYPFLYHNISFIRDSKWYLVNSLWVSVFDFTTNEWVRIKDFSDKGILRSTVGFYENDTLYLFSHYRGIIFKYDFENNELIEHSNIGETLNYPQMTNSIFKIGDDYYYTNWSEYKTISIFKFNEDFTNYEFLNKFDTAYIAQGIGFIFEDNIVFGLGGETSVNEEGTLVRYELNDKFYHYNVTENEFKEVKDEFYEGRFLGLPVTHDNSYYLVGGRTIEGNEAVYRPWLDKLRFDFVEE